MKTIAASSSCLECKCFPTDPCWPSDAEWSALNTTLGGLLIATVPLGQPCHDPDFNNGTCEYLQDQWRLPPIHMNSSSSVMAPYFANQSCDPFTAESKPCRLGNYVHYAVEAESAADVVAAIKFAQSHNIRFVIRNTGHDYLGRSTGAGALSVWTHHMKNITFKMWNDKYYQGNAVKMGAGVQGFDLLSAATLTASFALTGDCPTVGVAGGYSQGGGHSALSTSFGLSADNTLEWEVVTANGELITATRTNNSDLYWALSGGGPGNYGVVLSLTVRTHPDSFVGGATLQFNSSSTSIDNFYAAVDAFHAALPDMVNNGTLIIYYISSTSFQIVPLTAYSKTAAEVQEILSPYLLILQSMNITYTSTVIQSDSYYDHYNTFAGPLPGGNTPVGVGQYGGRLIPFKTVQENQTALAATVRSITEKNVAWIGFGTNVSSFGTESQNSVLPAWRDALVHVVLSTPWSFDPAEWDQMLANQLLMTDTVMPAIEAVTPGSGAYMNEGDFRQPDFQMVFFGSNYDALLKIKRKYDPDFFFYATKAVGSEMWTVSNDGRMCKA
ncbi:putative isoamyl alcohol oxidase [Gymnopus androsaceus JB14]|uniref:Isoamyl alcohol oxidase n=1 Tax=Gymnopus androsaceus JB14 TaxID=1447944 RepID=A0A6A4IUW7_9AGAR|nr:putative isoamyl alcohol oxidase [Gymnopus androsaceus JB14]